MLRAARDFAHYFAKAGGEDGPDMIHFRAEITRLRPTRPDHPAGSPIDDRTRARVVHPPATPAGQRWLPFWLQLR